MKPVLEALPALFCERGPSRGNGDCGIEGGELIVKAVEGNTHGKKK